ncbi:MAG: DUF72 domain-containing protein [Sutterella sp.]|nr:DUF72 domain-containing protein [Sutterella sp.]
MPQDALYDDAPYRGGPVERLAPTRALSEALWRMPRSLYLGLDGWQDARWRGLIYTPSSSPKRLAQEGLRAYAQHPLLRTVELPPSNPFGWSERALRVWNEQTPETFRFIVPITLPVLDPMQRDQRGASVAENPQFLEPTSVDWSSVLGAPQTVLGDKRGPVVFRLAAFDRMQIVRWQQRGGLVDRLEAFFETIKAQVDEPTSRLWALEVQNAEWLTPRLMNMLKRQGLRPVVSLGMGMKALVHQQRALAYWEGATEVEAWEPTGDVMIHWKNSPSLSLMYRPLNAQQLVASDVVTRMMIVKLIERTLAAQQRAWVWVGNRAEGSAPLSLIALLEALLKTR